MIDGQFFAIDGTKLKADCSKNKHLNASIVSKKLEKIDEKIDAYMSDFFAGEK